MKSTSIIFALPFFLVACISQPARQQVASSQEVKPSGGGSYAVISTTPYQPAPASTAPQAEVSSQVAAPVEPPIIAEAEIEPAPSPPIEPEPIQEPEPIAAAEPIFIPAQPPAEAAETDDSALASSWTEEPAREQGFVSQVSHEQVLRFAESLPGLDSWTVVPFAHFRRGDRHVVIAWPALNSYSRSVDATVVGIPLIETADGRLEAAGQRWVVRERALSLEALTAALGGEDYEVIGRDAGVALDQLGPSLSQLAEQFSRAVSSGDRLGARQAAIAFTGLLPMDHLSLENSAARLLWAATQYGGTLQHRSTVRRGEEAEITLDVTRGFLRYTTVRATARPVDGDDRWIVVDYREL
jgi:hypothetical protein